MTIMMIIIGHNDHNDDGNDNDANNDDTTQAGDPKQLFVFLALCFRY